LQAADERRSTPMNRKTVAIIGTLDTKGEELRFVRDLIEAAGLRTLVIDAGVLGDPVFPPGISREELAAAGGTEFTRLLAEKDRGRSVQAMAAGAAALARRLFEEGRIDGIISLGGSAGSTIGTAAMRALPVGVPKLMVSTLASGDTRPYVGTRDVTMMYPVVDIAGLNVISRRILANAAAAIAAMVALEPLAAEPEKPLIGATMFGVTTPCVNMARALAEQHGYEVLVFHATGTGGQALEGLIAGGFLRGVLDITTTELADELVGGILTAGPDRLEAAAANGVPQVVCPGAIDMVNFGPMNTVPDRFKDRKLHMHNPTVTLMRTTPEECAALGRITAAKLNGSRGPAAVVVPLRGVSAIDIEGGPFYSPEALGAYRRALKASLDARIPLIELDAHINDEAFAQRAAGLLIEMLDA
jgi:uncharacterized protein (UPF0261 family)